MVDASALDLSVSSVERFIFDVWLCKISRLHTSAKLTPNSSWVIDNTFNANQYFFSFL